MPTSEDMEKSVSKEVEEAMAAFANDDDDDDDDWNFSAINITSSPVKETSDKSRSDDSCMFDELDDAADDALLSACEEAEKSLEVSGDGEESDSSHLSGIPAPSEDHLKVLQQSFGHSKFRPHQWKIIYNVIEQKRDQCVIMATGYGKSLCYQFPPVYAKGLAIVISPLISLMTDQVLALEMANISACFLGSAQKETKSTVSKLLAGEYRVVYMSPEFCNGDYGHDLLDEMHKKLSVTLIAIDEAHCVSHWGHDFRSSYLTLHKLRLKFSQVPFLALTATATPKAKNDICAALRLRSPILTCTSFDRPNLYLQMNRTGFGIMADLKELMSEKTPGVWGFDGPTIIYCPTKSRTEEVALALKSSKIDCVIYHAGMTPTLRKQSHEQFVRDKVQIVVATVAFGMGIDKPDVRNVVHYGAPRDIESYYQEIGRAGRDGLPASCHVYWEKKDFNVHMYFLKDIEKESFREYRHSMIENMKKYLSIKGCRRKFLLEHFQPTVQLETSSGNLRCCDNCTRNVLQLGSSSSGRGDQVDSSEDFTQDAILLLKAVNVFNGYKGIKASVLLLRGSKASQLDARYHKHALYGVGKQHPDQWWLALADMLTDAGYLKKTLKKTSAYSWVSITVAKKGSDALLKCGIGKDSIKLEPSEELLRFSSATVPKKDVGTYHPQNSIRNHIPQPYNPPTVYGEFLSSRGMTVQYNYNTESVSPGEIQYYLEDVILRLSPTPKRPFPFGTLPTVKIHDYPTIEAAPSRVNTQAKYLEEQSMLYTEISRVRGDLASQYDCMPYIVASNKTVLELAKVRPSTEAKMLKVEGIVAAKMEKFGKPLLQTLLKWCEKNNVPLDCSEEEEKINVDKDAEQKLIFLSTTERETYLKHSQSGLDVENIAIERCFSRTTIVAHLIKAIELGLPVSLKSLGISDTVKDAIVKAIRSPEVGSKIDRLTPIKDNCPEHITWDQIKIVLAVLKWEYGVGSYQCRDEGVQVAAPVAQPAAPVAQPESPKKMQQTTLIAHLSPRKKAESNSNTLDGSAVGGGKPRVKKSTIQYLDDAKEEGESPRKKRKLPEWLSAKTIASSKLKGCKKAKNLHF